MKGDRHSIDDDDGCRFSQVEVRKIAQEAFLEFDPNSINGAHIAWKVLMRDGTTVPDCVLTFMCRSNQVKELEITADISLYPQIAPLGVIGHSLAEGTTKIRPTKDWSLVRIPMKFYRLVRYEKNKHIVRISLKSAKAKLAVKNPELTLPQ